MFHNYLKIALRNLWRQKTFSFINISGLAIGLACCILILLYTKDELSYDRFHANTPHLVRLTCKPLDKQGSGKEVGLAAMVQGPSFKAEIPDIQEFVRVREREMLVKNGANTFNDKATWVDGNFFTVFSFPLVFGEPSKVLSDVHALVVSEETAQKYFGTTKAVGKSLELEVDGKLETFVVTGVARNPPQNSTIKFSLVLPFALFEAHNPDQSWLMLSYSTYFLLRPNANLQAMKATMARVYATKAKTEMENERKHGWDGEFVWGVQPLTAMHLASDMDATGTSDVSNPAYSYILSAIALGILLLACINFVNLTIAQSLKRSKEIGIRKTIGGQRSQLMQQFLTESFLQTAIAFALALCLAELILPMFNDVASKKLSLSYLLDTSLVLGFFALFVLTALAAGLYPALVISGFSPAQTLFQRTRFVRKAYLAKGLVVVQFTLATCMVIGAMVMFQQFTYMTTKDLGYNEKNLLVLNVPNAQDMQRMNVFKTEFAKVANVEKAAPRTEWQFGTMAKANDKTIDIVYEHIDHDFIPTMGATLAGGRNFSSRLSTDSTMSVLVNEAFVRQAGWKEPVGKTIDFLNGKARNMTVVGVIKDYHFESLKGVIKPQLFIYGSELPFGQFLLRINPVNKAQTLASIEKIFRTLAPLRPFEYQFQEEVHLKNYKPEANWKNIMMLAAIFTVFISSIGLLGLTMLAAEQRTKEIGIRKVLGASVASIIGLLSKDFLNLVAVAIVIATPLAYWLSGKWLQDFAYRVELGVGVFALAGAVAVAIAFATVAGQSWRAARQNPVQSLRSE
jgi:putative ABC transport system permease protein